MSVWALGLNHTTAPLDLRGRFAFAIEQIGPVLDGLRQSFGSQTEATILSTCNRTEIYCASQEIAMPQTLQWLAESGGVSPNSLHDHVYTMVDNEAARHAFRVASGLDSMVLGEPQILGQMKDAVRVAREVGALGSTLHQMFQRSFAVAKQVRSSTEIGAHSISMSAASVRLAGQLFEDLSKINVLFVGAGEMIELCATHFAAKTPRGMTVANRTMERGELLARQLKANVMRLADLPDRLHEFDAVISCTASTLPLIGLGAVKSALRTRKSKPIFMVDLAVPRDIEPEVKDLRDVYLYTVDDLTEVINSGQVHRQAAVLDAEVIIDDGVQKFMTWLAQRRDVPLIQDLNIQADSWRQAEVMRARKLLDKGQSIESVLESLSVGMMKKMLNGPLRELNHAEEPQRIRAREAVKQMFLRP